MSGTTHEIHMMWTSVSEVRRTVCRLFAVVCLLMVTLFTAVHAQPLDCLQEVLPITERDLLDPTDRWSEMTRVGDSVRRDVLRQLVFTDSTGQLRSDIEVYLLSSCRVGPDSSVTVLAYLLDVDSKEEDQYVYLMSRRSDQWLGRTLIAQLQTSCSSTFLRACALMADGSVSLQQLEHVFDCDADAFLETKILPSFRVYLNDDGSFTEILEETAPNPDAD
jgi:hypothetical protein